MAIADLLKIMLGFHPVQQVGRPSCMECIVVCFFLAYPSTVLLLLRVQAYQRLQKFGVIFIVAVLSVLA
jgi:hypothetical protein